MGHLIGRWGVSSQSGTRKCWRPRSTSFHDLSINQYELRNQHLNAVHELTRFLRVWQSTLCSTWRNWRQLCSILLLTMNDELDFRFSFDASWHRGRVLITRRRTMKSTFNGGRAEPSSSQKEKVDRKERCALGKSAAACRKKKWRRSTAAA